MDRSLPAAPKVAPDLLGLAVSLLVELLASTSLFAKLGLSAAWTGAILSGLMAAAAYARLKLPVASGLVDKLAIGASALVVGLSAAGVFDMVGLSADGVAHLLGLILAVASAVRMLGAPKAAAATLVVFLLVTSTACAHAPSALSAARCLVKDPGLDEVLQSGYAAKVEAARARLLAGEAEADDLALLVEAAQLAARLSACVPKDAEPEEGAAK